MSSTQQFKSSPQVPKLSPCTVSWPGCIELRRRLLALQERQPPADPEARSIRIGIEDGYGDLVHVVETTRLIEAVRVFELLSDYGLVPGHGRCRASDGRTLMRTYRWPGIQDTAAAALAATGSQRTGSTVPGVAGP